MQAPLRTKVDYTLDRSEGGKPGSSGGASHLDILDKDALKPVGPIAAASKGFLPSTSIADTMLGMTRASIIAPAAGWRPGCSHESILMSYFLFSVWTRLRKAVASPEGGLSPVSEF